MYYSFFKNYFSSVMTWHSFFDETAQTFPKFSAHQDRLFHPAIDISIGC